MPARQYVKKLESIQSFVEHLPTDRLIFLAKASLDEVAKREVDRQRAEARAHAKPAPRVFQQQGRTLR